jgi:hypothetical protein
MIFRLAAIGCPALKGKKNTLSCVNEGRRASLRDQLLCL